MVSTSFGKPIRNSFCGETRLHQPSTKFSAQQTRANNRRKSGILSRVISMCLFANRGKKESSRVHLPIQNANSPRRGIYGKKECGPGQPPEPHSQA